MKLNNSNTQKRFSFQDIANDLGFGFKFVGKGKKLINEDGSFNIHKKGISSKSFYEHLVNSGWKRFFIDILIIYFVLNCLFAVLYLIAGVENFQGIEKGSFSHNFSAVFFFSVHTFTTVGYGHVVPNSFWVNVLSAFNALVGLLTLALLTGLFFARFSKAPASISFSKQALFSKLAGKDTFQFRIVNNSDATLINVEAAVTVTWLDKTESGYRRRFQRLPLQMDTIYLFPLNWTIVHEIDANSPLFDQNLEKMMASQIEFLVMVKAYNDTYGQTVFKNHSYHCEDIIKNATFLSMYETTEDMTILHLDKLDEFEKYEP